MDVSIIIVNYNTFKITCNCLSSVFNNNSSLSIEVIVVDNASTDESPDLFVKQFPLIKLVANKTNVGFGAANNQGMKIAQGKYLLLLNSDTIVNPDTFEKCYQFIESDFAQQKNIGLVGCCLLNADGSTQSSVFPYLKNNIFIYLFTTNPILNHSLKFLKLDKHRSFDFSKTQQVGDISGAFMFLKSELAQATGYFDTDFFMYCEDTEWCRERINKKSAIYYFAEASIIHLGGQSAPSELMYVQSKLSLSLLWYKKGFLNYKLYLLGSFLNCFSMIVLWPFVSKQSKVYYKRYIKSYFSIISYLFSDIPKYKKEVSSLRQPLIYKKVKNLFVQ